MHNDHDDNYTCIIKSLIPYELMKTYCTGAIVIFSSCSTTPLPLHNYLTSGNQPGLLGVVPLTVQRQHVTSRIDLLDKPIGGAYDNHTLVDAGRARFARYPLPGRQETLEVVTSAEKLRPDDAAQRRNPRGREEDEHRTGHSTKLIRHIRKNLLSLYASRCS